MLLVLAALLVVSNIVFFIMGTYFPSVLNKGDTTLPSQSAETQNRQVAIKEHIKDVSLHSPYAIVIDLEDRSTIYEKKIDERIYPASITKVMSAVVALDHIADLSQTVTVEEQDLAGLAEANASVAGFQAGDTPTYEELLYALILPSGADAANILGNHLFGSVDAYVDAMNEKAESLGMNATHFKNPIGLHEDDHYTTLADLTNMMNHAWINTAFQGIMTTTSYEIKSSGFKIKSTLLVYGDDLSFAGGEIIGGKSGYTLEAQCCLVSVAKMEDGHLYMIISAKAGGDPSEDHFHMNDAKTMYELIASTSYIKPESSK